MEDRRGLQFSFGVEELLHQKASGQSSPGREPTERGREVEAVVRGTALKGPVNLGASGCHQSTSVPLWSSWPYAWCLCHMTMRSSAPKSPHRGNMLPGGNVWPQLTWPQVLGNSSHYYFNNHSAQALTQNLGILNKETRQEKINYYGWVPVQTSPKNPEESSVNCHNMY